MNRKVFSKPYGSPGAALRAAAHHAWLAEHTPLRQPELLAVHPERLDFEHIDGRHAGVEDLPTVAAVLGEAHASAWCGDLCRASLNAPHPLPWGHTLPGFAVLRRAVLDRHHRDGLITDEELEAAVDLLRTDPDEPTTFYKDSNPRNILITPAGPTIVDTDDLTLAPFGYDLAKLVVTLAMTHGPIPPAAVTAALTAYNEGVASRTDAPAEVTPSRLLDHAWLHHLLTRPYLGRGGYRYPWPQVRPAPEDLT
ncbi:hypothetical protein GCM10010466_08790 [Planomonospora alba]|uniref:Aminoglycoside phosphotransferase domain-containing protein n=1 Tax=Planomonospora alba TaxID=161354 RepID=A0ABP6MN60_9ACTN